MPRLKELNAHLHMLQARTAELQTLVQKIHALRQGYDLSALTARNLTFHPLRDIYAGWTSDLIAPRELKTNASSTSNPTGTDKKLSTTPVAEGLSKTSSPKSLDMLARRLQWAQDKCLELMAALWAFSKRRSSLGVSEKDTASAKLVPKAWAQLNTHTLQRSQTQKLSNAQLHPISSLTKPSTQYPKSMEKMGIPSTRVAQKESSREESKVDKALHANARKEASGQAHVATVIPTKTRGLSEMPRGSFGLSARRQVEKPLHQHKKVLTPNDRMAQTKGLHNIGSTTSNASKMLPRTGKSDTKKAASESNFPSDSGLLEPRPSVPEEVWQDHLPNPNASPFADNTPPHVNIQIHRLIHIDQWHESETDLEDRIEELSDRCKEGILAALREATSSVGQANNVVLAK